jgi:hypothetical protein
VDRPQRTADSCDRQRFVGGLSPSRKATTLVGEAAQRSSRSDRSASTINRSVSRASCRGRQRSSRRALVVSINTGVPRVSIHCASLGTLATSSAVASSAISGRGTLYNFRWVELGGCGQLLDRLSGVSIAVGLEIAVVDVRRALDEDQRRILKPAAGRIGEQQRDRGLALASWAFFGKPSPVVTSMRGAPIE